MSDFFRSLSSAIGRIKIKSVVDNLIRFILALIFFLIIAAISKVVEWLLIFICVIIGLTFIVMIAMYVYFALTNPDYLRSEEYHLKKQSMEIIGDKDNYKSIDLGVLADITNPFIEAKEVEEG